MIITIIMTAVITMLISIIVFTMVIVPTVSRIGHRGSLLNVVSVFLPNIAIAVIMFRTGERTVYTRHHVDTTGLALGDHYDNHDGGHHDAHIDHSFYHGHCSNGVQDRIPTQYRHSRYYVSDWRAHRLYAPPRGYHWVKTPTPQPQDDELA
jgi:Ni/Co efflux regulator RcnB